jgi:pimeloyl-ACP methyl ester carboxylesterase
MPRVLVHGVPETPAVWDPLRAHLASDDVVAPQLPGFGCEPPPGFAATKEEYVAWLVGELEALQGDVDLVGHDWGGGFVVRVVSTRPDLVRSWVSDAAGMGDAGFAWHDLAKVWQTPEAGETFWEQQLALPAEAAAGTLGALGVPAEQALMMAGWPDKTMADCILALYRSAVDVGREWSGELERVPAPGMVLVAGDDPFLDGASARAVAGRAGAKVADLAGVGHWWMLQDPVRGAAVLEEFWASVT